MKLKFGVLFVVACLLPFGAFAIDLSGSVDVTETSETAAKAKTNAMNLARRQILSKVLSDYAKREDLNDLLNDTSNSDLVNFISSSSVSNEHISATVYSAKITMNIDAAAAKDWLDTNNVQNWIPIAETTEQYSLYIVLPNGITDWAELKRIARDNNTELQATKMTGYQVFAKMPSRDRSKFTIGIREGGWKYADNGGVLQIWK